MSEEHNLLHPRSQAASEPALSSAEHSDEPFACPYCGQMLAATCRVCVACKQPIAQAEIRRRLPLAPLPEPPSAAPARERVGFPWPWFFGLLGVRLFVAMVAERSLGIVKAELILVGVEFASAAWVFYDANQRGIPRVVRWAMGTLFLWVMVFPWYLARRRKPEATCPFVEGQAGPLARVLFIALAAFLVLAIVLTALQGPAK